ncbi:MAG TPA: SIMPL domain-containing protein [Flexivirga sp.]|uniref:SIMPL domain-containing protein n=1 Tax=Flexivirga sp. TaxID=1962927 RepID=UPI002C8FB12D|nr:SIMPL domain-containing protein [Flexivirga sp.]HWC21127.1 SIMPL domain-containing protein [Flexivirga sp.]
MADEQTGVTVTGVGSVRVPTTEAAVRLRIESRQPQPGAALREAGAAVTRAVDVLRAVGVPDTDVRTETVSVSPNKVWSEDTEQIRGYDAQQTVRVRVADLALLDQLLGELVEACGTALQVDDVSLSGDATESALAEARQEAVEHAHAKATDYARLTGRSLGRAESVVELGGVFRPPPPRGRPMAAGLAPMPVAQGEDNSTVSVQIHWSFE